MYSMGAESNNNILRGPPLGVMRKAMPRTTQNAGEPSFFLGLGLLVLEASGVDYFPGAVSRDASTAFSPVTPEKNNFPFSARASFLQQGQLVEAQDEFDFRVSFPCFVRCSTLYLVYSKLSRMCGVFFFFCFPGLWVNVPIPPRLTKELVNN